MKTLRLALASVIAVAIAPFQSQSQIVINEVAYDDTGTDDYEFIELYNAGVAAVDISGWVFGGRDGTTVNPAATIPGSTILGAGGYYVIGNAGVANVNQVVAANFLENDAEAMELWNGPIGSSTLIDGFVTEANKGAGTAATQYGTPTPEMLAQIGNGYRGNYQSGHVNFQGAQGAGTGPILVSLSRYVDGLDSNNNGRDFGLRRATPGAANSSAISGSYIGPDVNGLGVGTEAPGFYSAFVNPRVINPTIISTHNPSSIPQSPQGGNAITIWDTEFGGAGAGLDTVMQGDGNFRLQVYVDPRLPGGADSEEWILGIAGGADALHNFAGVAGTVNGSTGIGWLFRRDSTGSSLQLIDFGAGGPDSTWSILGTINLLAGDLGWHEIGIDITGTAVTGTFDSTVLNGSTASGLTGNLLYASYREGFASNADPLLRPLTIDLVPEPSTLTLLGLGAVALLGLRRRK